LLELRHQRNTDAYFDLFDSSKRNGISNAAKNKIYDIVETLLPKTTEKSLQRPLLLELFAEPGTSRSGWLSLVEAKSII